MKEPATSPSENTRNTGSPAFKIRLKEILAGLVKAYPDAECALNHRSSWELVVATILSAQCTDERVNKVTPALFERFPNPQAFASASREAIEPFVQSTGFFRNKAKSIFGAATRVVDAFDSQVPSTMEELLTLPGVARKTANVVLGTSFRKAEGVVVDTHVFRLSHRLGLIEAKNPVQAERQLMAIIPRKEWILFSHRLIHHGRRVCNARAPDCDQCTLEPLCPKLGVTRKKSAALKKTGPTLAERIARSKSGSPPKKSAAQKKNVRK